MIQELKDLELDLNEETLTKEELIDLKLKEKLEIGLDEIKLALSNAVKDKADSISEEFINIAPNGDYDLLLRDKKDMANFIMEEAYKPEHWKLYCIKQSETNSLFDFVFYCDIVDDGDTFCGHVMVSKSGKIRHAFAQSE